MPRHPRDQSLLDRFGAHVEGLRKRAALTQQAVAERVGVRSETISQIESGKLSPTLTSVVGLAKALGVRPSALLDFEELVVGDACGADETGLLDDYRALTEDGRGTVRAVARGLRR